LEKNLVLMQMQHRVLQEVWFLKST
jgi:hypothetical protein